MASHNAKCRDRRNQLHQYREQYDWNSRRWGDDRDAGRPGQGTLQIFPEKAPAGLMAVIFIELLSNSS
jgi:hypothetical protein